MVRGFNNKNDAEFESVVIVYNGTSYYFSFGALKGFFFLGKEEKSRS